MTAPQYPHWYPVDCGSKLSCNGAGTSDRPALPLNRGREFQTCDVALEPAVGRIAWHREHAGRISPRRLEDDEPEVRDSGHPELNAQPEAGQCVDASVDEQSDDVEDRSVVSHDVSPGLGSVAEEAGRTQREHPK